MDHLFEKIVRGMGIAAGAIVGLLGGWDVSMQVLVAFMVIDYSTGLLVGLYGRSLKTENGGLDSNVGLMGIIKKLLMLAIVVVAVFLDKLIGQDALLRSCVVFFFIANEGLSILENVGLMGVKLPARLQEALEKLKEKDEA